MNETTIIYGASDDLIEVEGAYPEEFNHYSLEPARLSIDNGAIELEIHYDGEWRIKPVRGEDRVTILPPRGEGVGDDEDGCPGYSEKAIIQGNFGVEYVAVC